MKYFSLAFLPLLFILTGGYYWFARPATTNHAMSASAASILSEDMEPAAGFVPPAEAPVEETISSTTPLKRARTAPQDTREYRNTHYRFALFYPKNLDVQEYDEGSGVRTITFEDPDTAYGFQIFIKPYGQQQVNSEVFKIDEPSGVKDEPKPIVIAGAQGTEFFGHNDQMDDTREIWFIHGGYLFEVYTYKPLDSWLAAIMKTWKFL